ncbi:hypothetical protein MLD38_031398 [Melastoma candidum]|uniref:Uncharacterized protein n=1 Tax=Melastoma candidum TaxID=119954 RepID=A0ACB9MUD6_9MYRT|nr:hypothetical protein MLD38_031398 [Melastoma candidum]
MYFVYVIHCQEEKCGNIISDTILCGLFIEEAEHYNARYCRKHCVKNWPGKRRFPDLYELLEKRHWYGKADRETKNSVVLMLVDGDHRNLVSTQGITVAVALAPERPCH